MIGSRLGKWVVDKELGRGGMGRVYLAHEEAGDRQGALKVLAAELAQEPGFLQRFQREIDVLRQLSHPNIVRFYESGTQDGHFYFAMEYVDGESFEQILHRQGRLPWKEVVEAALQICPALKHAHDHGIIHRDLKPPNLLRTPAGVIKLTDFGIAKVFAGQQLTSTGGVVGTAEYLSPEQAAGKLANKRSDLYSLGVVLYTLLTGRTPFEGRTTADLLHKHLYGQFDRPQKLVPDIPHEVDEVVCQLLEKDPVRRPADSLVLYRQLDRLRRKLDRKSERTLLTRSKQHTIADNPAAGPEVDNPGPATLMSQLVRQELHRQRKGNLLSQWLNQPWVLLPLFLLCVGLLVWRFLPQSNPSPEWLFEQGSARMASENPDDWEKAWSEYLEPLNRTYPDHAYRKEVEAYRQKIDDRADLQRALAGVKGAGSVSAAQRFYQRGLRLCQQGDIDAARQVWGNVIRTFQGVPSEGRWVRLSGDCLQQLNNQAPPTQQLGTTVQEALQQARRWRDHEQRQKAEEIWKGLEALYRDDASAQEVLRQVQRDRGQ